MAEVIIYTKPTCPYCMKAKELLNLKGLAFQEISVEADSAKRKEMIELTGRHTVPQIIIDHKPIGGYDDLYSLEIQGQLDSLLNH